MIMTHYHCQTDNPCVLKKVDTASVIDVLKETNNKSVSAIKELTDTMKDLTNESRTASQISSQALQEESTQTLLETGRPKNKAINHTR